jgi:hypothetical protein
LGASCSLPSLTPLAVFPLVGENKRYLVDENSAPFLMQGDAAWSLIVELNATEFEQYLNNRH